MAIHIAYLNVIRVSLCFLRGKGPCSATCWQTDEVDSGQPSERWGSFQGSWGGCKLGPQIMNFQFSDGGGEFCSLS